MYAYCVPSSILMGDLHLWPQWGLGYSDKPQTSSHRLPGPARSGELITFLTSSTSCSPLPLQLYSHQSSCCPRNMPKSYLPLDLCTYCFLSSCHSYLGSNVTFSDRASLGPLSLNEPHSPVLDHSTLFHPCNTGIWNYLTSPLTVFSSVKWWWQ